MWFGNVSKIGGSSRVGRKKVFVGQVSFVCPHLPMDLLGPDPGDL